MAPPTSGSNANAIIKLEEEIEGDQIGSRDYRFCRIGEPVPIKADGISPFDLEDEVPPSQPLAVSERFRLIFVAHSDGFCVARTNEVLASAKEIKDEKKGLSVQESCSVDISIGLVSILALSADESLLAATVGSEINFFPVSTLLLKEQKPSFSFSLNESFIKDMQWAKKEEKIYLLLSSEGKLYCGHGQSQANYVMDNVDAVGWSANGDCVAVARNNVISILSSRFEEKLSLEPSFKLMLSDSDAESVIRVDAVRWVRPDSIVLGCIQVNDDGEETYALQVITGKNGKIDDDSSKPVIQSFTNVFSDFRSDAVPFASGPHLFFSYLDNHGLAFVANRKNLEQHILLFGWSVGEGTNEAAMIEILNDSWSPKIEAQECGDDILVLGLAIDKISQQKGLKLLLGEEEKEVSPCCVFLCLAGDGRLSAFHFASAAGASATSPIFTCSDEKEHTSTVVLSDHVASEVQKKDVEGTGMKSKELNISESDIKAAGVAQQGTQPSVLSQEDIRTSNQGPKLLLNLGSEYQHKLPVMKPSQDRDGLQSPMFGKQDENLKHSSVNASQPANPETLGNSLRMKAVHSAVEAKTSIGSASGTPPSVLSQDAIRTSNQGPKPLLNLGSEDQHKLPVMKLSQDRVGLQSPMFGIQDENLKHSSVNASQPANPETLGNSLRMKAVHTTVEAKTSIGSDSVKTSNNYSQSFGKSMQTEHPMGVQGRTQSTGFSNAASFAGTLKGDERSPFSFGNIQQKVAGNSDRTTLSLSGGHPQSSPWTQAHSTSVDSSKQKVMPWAESIKSSSSLQQNISLQKPSKLQPARDTSERIPSKQFRSVEEMARKLDDLLEGIEGEGGFMNASIASQKNSVINLEKGIQALSDRCRLWRGIMDERQGEIQLLLDKTVKVLAKKVYMEGILKQATDSRYLDLWSRQKLSSELDLKQEHIRDMNKVLTNQLIELERHFNILELNTFGGSDGMQMNRRASQSKHGQGRNVQSLHSLRDTVNAQLAVAEQLSGSLSKLMSDLNIDSSTDRRNVRKELFETIGLSYDDTAYSTPAKEMVLSTPLNKERSVSFAAKEQSWRKQTDAAKSSEPETARRRRDSLDRSWASFEPSKTTVKRILLREDHQKVSASRASLSADKQQLNSQSYDRSAAAGSNLYGASSTSFQQFKSTGFPDISEKLSSRSPASSQWAGGLGKPAEQLSSASNFSISPLASSTSFQQFKSTGFPDISGELSSRGPTSSQWADGRGKPAEQLSSARNFSISPLAQTKSTVSGQSISRESGKLTNENSTSNTLTGNLALGQSKFIQQSETKPHLMTNSTLRSESPIPLKVSLDSQNPDGRQLVDTNLTVRDQKNVPIAGGFMPTELKTSSGFSFSPATVTDPAFNLPGNVMASEIVLNRSQAGGTSISTSVQSVSSSLPAKCDVPSLSSSSFSSPSVSKFNLPSTSTTLFSSPSPAKVSLPSISSTSSPGANTPTSSGELTPDKFSSILKASSDSNQMISLSQSSGASQTNSAFHFPNSQKVGSSPITPESKKSDPKSLSLFPTSNIGSKDDTNSATTPSSINGHSANLQSGSQMSSASLSSPTLGVGLNAKQEQSFDAAVSPLAAVSTSQNPSGGNNENTDAFIDEDEMEEVAPETNQATEQTLGNLAGFGIGGSTTVAAAKPNIFGTSLSNKTPTPTSSTFTMTAPSGELFRPASFSFPSLQPPQPPSLGSFSGGFTTSNVSQAPTGGGFGQPSQIGSGQHALGSVLGAFGQSRQFGAGLAASGSASASGFGTNFISNNSGGSFGGGFSGVSAVGGGFSNLASAGGGFAGAAGAGGFAAAATPTASAFGAAAGGGFGGFSSQQGAAGFSAFGNSSAAARPPSQLFTQMRK
ncbi:PREDICTED: nuclear pore complex protein NUP214 isoform X2 [Ipomoea nil]|uniref:nuclear pore complex protein NUP214 isoform X2 n=1 Tax=Ipomoea nil TaxID=35883 RepID=UPI000900A5B5|nr:PREDICTED: nuclear pore complex protein NUP214 isoform X2 [Ipomoea nil]